MVPINMTVYENETVVISLGFKVFGLVMYLINCFGIFSIFGIIHYEKFGQDPQKRSFSDQIFTFNCKMFMIICPIFWGIGQIRWLFGPIGYTLAVFRYYLSSSLLCIPLGFTESILFQCLMIFSWKKCAMINDEFFAMFFNFTNFIVTQMISVIRLMTGEYERKELFVYWSDWLKEDSRVEVQIEKPYVPS